MEILDVFQQTLEDSCSIKGWSKKYSLDTIKSLLRIWHGYLLANVW
jgi:hypothetical protein